MRRSIAVFSLALLMVPTIGQCRDTTHYYSISDAMQSAEFKEKLDSNIRLAFGTQPSRYHKVVSAGEITNKKTNAFMKSDEAACQHVFLSALLQLQDTAKAKGGKAVTHITSFYKRNPYSSNSKYECHAGSVMAGVALKGDIVK